MAHLIEMRKYIFAVLLLFLFQTTFCQSPISFVVNGQQRTAILHQPVVKSEVPAPVLLVFHGHYGNALHASRTMPFHTHYPEAYIVYMQGLSGLASFYDKEGKGSGWQSGPGEAGNRDLLFTDTVLNFLFTNYKIDSSHIFAAGHSNGALFAYVLWNSRPQLFKAFIAVAAQAGRLITKAPPRSIYVSIGNKDPLVPASLQLRSVPIIKEVLKTSANPSKISADALSFQGIDNTNLVVELREKDGHSFPKESISNMVAFLRKQ